MKSSEFSSYRSEFRAIFHRVLSESEEGRMDEAAFPAYSHPNPVINWLFWQRLRVVMDYINRHAPYARALDFGCGSGVMLPFLGGISRSVIAMDVDLLPFERVRNYHAFPANLEVLDACQQRLQDLPRASFDLIVALDVLEHVDDLPATLTDLQALLMPGGQIVVSGPTENFLYKLGRALAGPEYSGYYHERSVADVRALLTDRMQVSTVAVLYRPFPLFDIFAAHA
jgi:2-polyprenyl-3-methyl-5-hydroxy-6-metoxy-1,4-benzoquinol methylase